LTVIDLSMLGPERVRPLRRDEYDRLVALGCFEDERIELLGGALVEMSPQGAPHAYVVSRLAKLVTRTIGDRAEVRSQLPLGATADSEPEPDLALVPNDDYSREHPTRAFLVVEVADSSLRKDRRIKAALYAQVGIPEYWIVNLDARAVEVYRQPAGGAYASVTTHGAGEVLRPQAFDDIEVPVDAILPSR
jgi:Uma2 family endonuclease